MRRENILAVCRMGGEFIVNSNGSMSYDGGEAHAINIERDMTLLDFLSETSDMFNCDTSIYSVKYFLPENQKTLITISTDKDLKRMVEYSGDAVTTDVFLVKKAENPPSTPQHKPNWRTRSVIADSVPTNAIIGYETTAENPKRQKIDSSWESMITGVGQVFDSPKVFRDALHRFAIAKGFMYKFVKNEGPRINVRCSAEDCPWRIYASKSSDNQKLTIKTMTDMHTCGGESSKERSRLATQSWIASVIKDKLRETPNYRPRDIAKDLEREYGLSLSYHRAWRGKSIAEKELHGSHEEAASQLPWFCEKLMESNPGSFAIFESTEDSNIGRLFVSFHASLHGFEDGCRPLLFLENLSLKAVKQWKLLSATGVDGENDIFPVAFAVVEVETAENWRWFLERLRSGLLSSRTVTFVSKRQNGLEAVLSELFEEHHYGFCVNDLIDDFKAELEDTWTEELKDAAVEDFTSAVYACKIDEFNSCLERIKADSKDVAEWILASKPEHWSNAFFKGVRYGRYSSNASETFNAWISTRNEPSVVQAVDMIRCKIMEMIYFRREKSSTWVEPLTPLMTRKVQEEMIRAQTLQVIGSDSSVYEVREGEQLTNIVNIGTWECTCRRWQVIGLPCMHAIAVVELIGEAVSTFCSEYFTTKCYCAAYATSINPIADPVNTMVTCPVNTRRGRGRPKLKPDEPVFHPVLKSKRAVQCSRCREYGHYKQTCKTFM